MAEEPIDPLVPDRSWRLWTSLALGAILTVAALFAFIVLPAFQRENAGVDLWTAFCRSLGIVEGSPAYPQPTSDSAAAPVSLVSWGPNVLGILDLAEPQRGARIAGAVCAGCHGENGVSTSPELPSLAGQSAAAIYKQLHDYRSGARVHPQMTPIARQLQVPDMANVAAFYGRAQPYAGLGRRGHPASRHILTLVNEGDSARRLPACNACHVNGSGGPIETPVLSGQNAEYLARQLRLYRSDQRRNDVYRRMRQIARQLSEQEIDELARYYQGVI